MNIILFTQTYPSFSSSEQTFIGRELPYLLRHIENITIVPKKLTKERVQLDRSIRVEEGFSVFYTKEAYLGIIKRAIFSKSLCQEIKQNPAILFSLKKIARLIKFIGDAEIVKEWTKKWFEEENIKTENTLLYSFWFTQIAFGLGLLKEDLPKIKTVARGHGYDIYEERYRPPYFPCRIETLKRTDALFLASLDVHRYMKKNYPAFSQKYHTAHLGVNAPGFLNQPSKDNIFRITSCSSIIPLKRVELLAESIALASKIRPDQKIHWVHFGDGKRKKNVEKIIDQFPSSVDAEIKGWVPNKEILTYYEHNPVDVFVNLSTTEGGAPVSIQEALSCGIPVIATSVGGNPEIVSDVNGLLLGNNPSPTEISQAFFDFIDNPEKAKLRRKGSLAIWKENYNAARNFEKFAQQLLTIMSEK